MTSTVYSPRSRRLIDGLFALFGLCLLVAALSLLGLLLFDLAMAARPALRWDFLTTHVSSDPATTGVLAPWVGSVLVVLLALVVAVPVGVAAATYLEEYAAKNWLNQLVEINISNLAGVPSIIWGLAALGLFATSDSLRDSLLAGGLALGMLVLPIVVVSSREAIRAVPRELREAAAAMGASPWQVTAHHVLPASFGGILTGVIIGVSRAIGETAPLLVLGAVVLIQWLPPAPSISAEPPFLQANFLYDRYTVLPVQMYSWIEDANVGFHACAAATGLFILILCLSLNALAIFLRARHAASLRGL